ncbi:unnamed protein product [Dicrocoelium dendriticum]|nr:unnamed protein product [Dicrocoelium dendriticum]
MQLLFTLLLFFHLNYVIPTENRQSPICLACCLMHLQTAVRTCPADVSAANYVGCRNHAMETWLTCVSLCPMISRRV